MCGPRWVSKVKDGERVGEVARAAEVQREIRLLRRHRGVEGWRVGKARGERAGEPWRSGRTTRETVGRQVETVCRWRQQGLTEAHFRTGWGLIKVLKRRWYLLESERFGEEHEGKYDSHGLSPCGHCRGCVHKKQQNKSENKKSTGVTSCKTSSCTTGLNTRG